MFKCEICDKEFEKKSQLTGHKAGAHRAEKKTIEKATKNQTTDSPPLSVDERAIADLVAGEDSEWEQIREDELNDFSLMKNPLDLPPEAQKLQDELVYAFRWCERKPDRVRELTRAAERPMKWKLVNRTTIPELGHLVDSMLGGVCVLDQILLYKPWHDHELVKTAKMELADIQDQSGTLKGKSLELSGEGIHADASVRNMDERPTGKEISGSDVVMATETDGLGDLVVQE